MQATKKLIISAVVILMAVWLTHANQGHVATMNRVTCTSSTGDTRFSDIGMPWKTGENGVFNGVNERHEDMTFKTPEGYSCRISVF